MKQRKNLKYGILFDDDGHIIIRKWNVRICVEEVLFCFCPWC